MDRDFIENHVHVNSNGAIVVESVLGDISEIIPFIEDNVYSKDGYGDAEGIEWAHVWKDYDDWRNKCQS